MVRPATARAPSTSRRPSRPPFTVTLELVHLGYRLGDPVVVLRPHELRLPPWAAEDQGGRSVHTRGLGLGRLELLGEGARLQVGAPLVYVETRCLHGLVREEVVGHVATVLLPLVLEEQLGVGPVAVLLSRGERRPCRHDGVRSYERERFGHHLDLTPQRCDPPSRGTSRG